MLASFEASCIFNPLKPTNQKEPITMKNETYRKSIQEMFLDYFNNYISIEKFSIDNDLSIQEAKLLIKLGQKVQARIAFDHISNNEFDELKKYEK